MSDAHVPSEEDRRGRRTRKVALVVGAVLLSCVAALIAGAILAAPTVSGFLADALGVFRVSYTFTDMWMGFTADGSKLVVPASDVWGVPRVFAVEMESGEVHRIDGWRMVAFDAESGTAWVEREPGLRALELSRIGRAAAEKRVIIDAVGDWVDHPTTGLYAWRLGDDAPSRVTSSVVAWGPRAGPAGISAEFECEPKVGANPRSVTFVSPRGGRVEAASPWPLTVVPVGWSASGRYLALVETVPPEDRGLESYRLDVLDARDGSVAASVTATFRVGLPDMSTPIWDASADVLYWQSREATGPLKSAIVALDPSTGTTEAVSLGGMAPVFIIFSGPSRFSSRADTETLRGLGGTKDPDVDRVELWSMRGGRPVHIGFVRQPLKSGLVSAFMDPAGRPVVRSMVFGPDFPNGSPMRSDFRFTRGSQDASGGALLLDTRDYPPVE